MAWLPDSAANHMCYAMASFRAMHNLRFGYCRTSFQGSGEPQAPTTTAHEWHGRYSILKHAPYNLKYKSCAKLKRAQLIQKEKRKRIAIMMVLQATS